MSEIVISLTSYPDRIQTVHCVIESLFEQTEKADKIILWLSKQEFPRQYEDLPDNLKCLVGTKGFRIEWVSDNLKSHKKYFYALQDSNSIVITVDDDVCYASTMVHTLVDSYRKHPNAISARNVHMIFRKNNNISPYMTWESYVTEYMGKECMDLCAIGVGGILYPPGCANERWFDKQGIKECAENQDDLWLKFNEIIDNIPVVYVAAQEEDNLIEGSQDSALYIKNAHEGENDISINKLVNRMRNGNEEIYNKWISGLMEVREFVLYKRDYYGMKIKELCSCYSGVNIYIGGAGKYAHILLEFIKEYGKAKHIKAFLVSEIKKNESQYEDMMVKQINELKKNEHFIVICGVGSKYRNEIKQELERFKFCEWIDIGIQDIVRLKQLEKFL